MSKYVPIPGVIQADGRYKRKAEKLFDKKSTGGRVIRNRKKKKKMLDEIMNPNNRKYSL